jgi:diguanylate cyclase (GGDEF)-like protein/PAS domain S-box-containing protein
MSEPPRDVDPIGTTDALARAARERYTPATVDALPVLFFVVSDAARLIHVNRAVARLFGADEAALVGTSIHELLALESAAEIDRRFRDAIDGGATTGEVRVRAGDGRERPLLLSLHRIELLGRPVLVGTGVDLGPRIEAERRADTYEALVRAAFDASPAAMVVVSDDGRIAVTNERFERTFPAGPSAPADAFLERVARAAVEPDVVRRDLAHRLVPDEGRSEGRVRLTDGRTFEHVSVPFLRPDGASGRVVQLSDVTDVVEAEAHLAGLNARLGRRVDEQWAELRAATDRLEHLAFHDALTGLANRRHLYAEIEGRLNRLRTGDPDARPFDLVYVDLDAFKSVNDRYGHDAGDRVLSVQAERMSAFAAPFGWAGRLAGDEFVLVLDAPPGDGLSGFAQRLEAELARPIDLDGVSLSVSGSIGLAHGHDGVAGPDALLAEADTEMYEKKRALKRRRDDR